VRGEETPASCAGIENGLICSAGTHPKWIEMKNGRIDRFATYMIGEMYGLRIPTQSVHVYRLEVVHASDLIPSTLPN